MRGHVRVPSSLGPSRGGPRLRYGPNGLGVLLVRDHIATLRIRHHGVAVELILHHIERPVLHVAAYFSEVLTHHRQHKKKAAKHKGVEEVGGCPTVLNLLPEKIHANDKREK